MDIEEQRLRLRRYNYNLRNGANAAERLIAAPYEGRTLQQEADKLGVTRQYISSLYIRLSGRTWSSVLSEKGIKLRGPRNQDHHPETV